MTLFEKLDKKELKELLVKNWMTHDGMWFLNAYLSLGIKTANKLNKSAIKSLAPIESARIQKALGKKNLIIDTFDKLKQFIDDSFSIVKGDFMNFEYSFPKENLMHWKMHKCFAYEGMKKIGVADQYECGVLYRIKCWLDALKLDYKIEPRIKRCLMASGEKCEGNVKFFFK
ncbi:MAG: DUF6125 family protein [Promethearchaeota archaeon]